MGGHGLRFDLQTHATYIEDVATEISVGLAQLHHENSHWIRFHGTTIGHFLNLVRYASYGTALTGLAVLVDAPIVERALRIRQETQLWRAEEHYTPSLLGHDFAMASRIWTELKWAESILMGRTTQAPDRHSAARAVAATWLHSDGIDGYATYPGDQEATPWVHGDVKPALARGREVTTQLLWESAATIDELMPVELEDAGDDVPLKRALRADLAAGSIHSQLARIKAERSDYGMPIRALLERAPNATVAQAMFAIDYALNPPLPLFGQAPNGLSWEKFSPPHRFLEICRAMEGLRASDFDDILDQEGHLAANLVLQDATGLMNGALEARACPRGFSIAKTMDGAEPFHAGLITASLRLLEMREIDARHFLFPRNDRGWGDLIRLWPQDTTPMLSYLYCIQGVSLSLFHGPSTNQLERYIDGATLDVMLNSFFSDSGPMASVRQPRLPDNHEGCGHAERAMAVIERLLAR